MSHLKSVRQRNLEYLMTNNKLNNNNSIQSVSSTVARENLKTDNKRKKMNDEKIYPFTLKEKIVKLQNNNDILRRAQSAMLVENKKIPKTNKNSLNAGFEMFCEKNNILPLDKQRKSSVKINGSIDRKLFENLNSARVLNPNLDKNFGCGGEERISRKKINTERKGTDDLVFGGMNYPTNNLHKTGIKIFRSSLKKNINIFSKEYNNYIEPSCLNMRHGEFDNPNGYAGARTSSLTNRKELTHFYPELRFDKKKKNRTNNFISPLTFKDRSKGPLSKDNKYNGKNESNFILENKS